MNGDENSRPNQSDRFDRYMNECSLNSSFPEDHKPANAGCQVDASSPDTVTHPDLVFVGEPRVGGMFLGFHLIEVLGKGSFGTVYLARQGNLADRPVALKISPRLDSEPRLLARLQHTNIVPIYSIHHAMTLQVVCMPFLGTTTLKTVCDSLRNQVTLPETGLGLISSLIEGKSERETRLSYRSKRHPDLEALDLVEPGLAAVANSEQPAPTTETLKYLEGLTYVQAILWVGSRLASGLAHAHERRILHLDLKPANILLTDEGQPMLLDFNLSWDLKRRSSARGSRWHGPLHVTRAPRSLSGPIPIARRPERYLLAGDHPL